eukprot:scaffold4850_cov213-Pinguiococcus_pyrenoidosus.AAC.26
MALALNSKCHDLGRGSTQGKGVDAVSIRDECKRLLNATLSGEAVTTRVKCRRDPWRRGHLPRVWETLSKAEQHADDAKFRSESWRFCTTWPV